MSDLSYRVSDRMCVCPLDFVTPPHIQLGLLLVVWKVKVS